MPIKPVVALTFDARKDTELLGKLNAVAPYYRKKVHTLAREFLMKELNEAIATLGIQVVLPDGRVL